MIKTFKVMLLPNNKQRTKLFGCAGAARFAFNWALGYEKENHEKGEKYLTNFELRKVFTNLKRTEEFKWLNNYSNNITKQAIKDSCNALERFFNKQGISHISRAKEGPNHHFMLILIKFRLQILILNLKS